MALSSSVYIITAPAAAAAMGLFLFGRNNLPNNSEGGGGISGAASSGFASKRDVKTAAEPKLAPQFDGLHCFETIVGN